MIELNKKAKDLNPDCYLIKTSTIQIIQWAPLPNCEIMTKYNLGAFMQDKVIIILVLKLNQ